MSFGIMGYEVSGKDSIMEYAYQARACIVYQGTLLCILSTGLWEALAKKSVKPARTPA